VSVRIGVVDRGACGVFASSAFWSNWAWAAATAVVGFVFFGLVLRQYLARRKPHQLAWSIGLFFYAVAAAMEAWSEDSLAIFFVGAFTVQLDTAKLVPGITAGGQALGPSLSFPRVMSLPFNISGTILPFGGAAWSIWRFARRHEYGYRVWANLFIAAGAALLAFLGSRARLGNTTGLYPAEMVAVALMFVGFLLAGTLDKGARRVQARRKAAAGGTGS